MRLVSQVCVLFVAIIALTGCGKPAPGQIVGTWTMQEKPQTWEFKSDGSLVMEGAVGAIQIKQAGTYILNGTNLTLNLSGKSEATSGSPKDKISVNKINSAPAQPKQEDWNVEWASPTEFTISTSHAGETVTKTFDRSS